VHAHYDGKDAATGKQFDSSRKRGQPFTFPLGGGRVIQGWDLGFNGMKVGEKAILQIDSSLG
jgi:peptidylprolyl isomerase